jgi:pantothenate synthetase
VDLDYAVLVDAADLTRAASTSTDRPLRLLIAAQVSPVRLIDNLDPRRTMPSLQPPVTKGTN